MLSKNSRKHGIVKLSLMHLLNIISLTTGLLQFVNLIEQFYKIKELELLLETFFHIFNAE